MVQAVESTNSSVKATDKKSDTPSDQKRSDHLHLVNETNDPGVRVGARLKSARAEKNLTIEDVARHLKFRREYLEAIESMQVSLLPKGFVNPYIRDYARFLGLDPAKTVEDFNIQCGALSQAEEDILDTRTQSNDNTNIIKFIVGLVVVALMAAGAYAAYSMFTSSKTPDQVQTVSPVAPTPQISGASSPVMRTATPKLAQLSDTMELSVRARERAWIEIRGADGTVITDKHFPAGHTFHDLRIDAGWTLTTQNAGAFEWVVNGEPAGLLGEPDQRLYTLSIDEVAIAFGSEEG